MGTIQTEGTTRRDFIRNAGLTAGALGTLGVAEVLGCASSAIAEDGSAAASSSASSASAQVSASSGMSADSAESDSTILVPDPKDTGGDNTYMPMLQELATPETPAPDTTDYQCDVLVVGGGLAGLNAAFSAAEEGKSVILVDKGTPGYSGLSAWPSCNAYYDPDLDADRDLWEKYMLYSCENFANLDWEDVWLDESKDTFQRLKDWGWITSYDNGVDAGYWVDGLYIHDDAKGYFNHFADKDRRKVFMQVLNDNGVTVVDHVMIADFIEDDGKCVGAVGVHYKSKTVMTFSAKAVILCTGTGVTKSTGFPTGGDTFDGLIMGYEHGLSVTGLEFEDYHSATSFAAGNPWAWTGWQYVEPVWPTGGTVNEDALAPVCQLQNRVSAYQDGYTITDITNVKGDTGAACSVAVTNGNTEDPRIGKYTSPQPRADRVGSAIGMPCHLGGGIWCGVDDTEGNSGIPGLYVAGDGTNGCYVGGPNYGCQRGSTSNFVSIQGYRAGKAASEYIADIEQPVLPDDQVSAVSNTILAPLSLEKGFDPSWVRDVLHGIMSPGWITVSKEESGLTAALTEVQHLRELTSGKMLAKNGHDVRLCLEVEHQMLAMDIKLHADLERKESRGNHYRSDYQFKDDENYLCYLTFTKGDDGEPVVAKVDLKDRWKGDMTADYATRYKLEFPGEIEKYGTPADSSSKKS